MSFILTTFSYNTPEIRHPYRFFPLELKVSLWHYTRFSAGIQSDSRPATLVVCLQTTWEAAVMDQVTERRLVRPPVHQD